MFSLFNLYHPFLTESGAAAVSRANSPAVKCDERKKNFFFLGWGSKFGHVRGIGDWPLQQPISEVGEKYFCRGSKLGHVRTIGFCTRQAPISGVSARKIFLSGVQIWTSPDNWCLRSSTAHEQSARKIFLSGVKIRTCPDYWLLHSASAHQWSECEENIFVGGPNLDMSRVLAFALRKRPSVKCDEIILFGGQN
jgi:hypothetical protein